MLPPARSALLLLVTVTLPLAAQDVEGIKKPKRATVAPTWFAHVGAGLGMGFASSEVTELLNDEFGIGLSLPLTLLARVGYRNLLQVEYRLADASHTLRNTGIVNGQFATISEIPMDYDTRDLVVKLNPRFGTIGRPTAWYLVAGRGTVEWRDEAGDGFSGTSTIFGLEGAMLTRSVMIHYGIAYYSIRYEESTLAGVTFPSNISGSDLVLYFNFSVGFGR